jgi:integrase
MVLALGTPKRHPESGIYWFRKRVPDRLRDSVGRTEIKFSLRTRDPQVARLRNLDAMLRLERVWAGDVALLGADGVPVAFYECKGLAAEAPAGISAAKPDVATAEKDVGAPDIYAELRTALRPAGRDTVIRPTGVRAARPESIVSSSELASSEIASSETAFSGHASSGPPVSGCGSSTHDPAGSAADIAGRASMRGLFESYTAEAELSPATVKRWKPVIEAFVAHLGHDDAGRVARADVVRWKDSLLAAAISNITVRDVYVGAVRATLQYGADQRGLPDNPAAGVKVRVKKKLRERDQGFDHDEALKILAATRRPPSANISEEMAMARRWVPWLCAYSGGRVNEYTPLSGRDILVRKGIVMMRIRAETNKTRRSRMVPVQGFLTFVAQRDGKPLFFGEEKLLDAKFSIHKTRAEGLGDWARGVAGIAAYEVAPNHGWRHHFKTECRRIKMDREVRFYLQGHAFKIDGEEYGYFPLDVTAAWMDLFPTYDVRGESLAIHRVSGSDIFGRAVALLHVQRDKATFQAAELSPSNLPIATQPEGSVFLPAVQPLLGRRKSVS